MKRIVILAIILLHFGAGLSFAGQFGPPQPQTEPGQFSFGTGAFKFSDTWYFKADGFRAKGDIRQTQVFLQGNIGLFPEWESYARLGVANLRRDIRDSLAPYGTIGLKGIAYRGKYLDVGGFVEGSYFSDYTGTFSGMRFEVDNSYTANAGVAFQREVEGALLYAGPFWHYRKGDFTSDISAISGSLRANRNVGGFVGIRWTPVNDIVIEGEVQYRDKVSGGLAISFLFDGI
jgi:hypothetical protein